MANVVPKGSMQFRRMAQTIDDTLGIKRRGKLTITGDHVADEWEQAVAEGRQPDLQSGVHPALIRKARQQRSDFINPKRTSRKWRKK